MINQIHQFTPHIKKKLYILDAFPRTNSQYTLEVAKDLKNGRKLEEIYVSFSSHPLILVFYSERNRAS